MSYRIEFDHRILWLRSERADLLRQLDQRVAREDDKPVRDLPHDWGIAGDLQSDIALLRQLLRMDG
jgi:hypothetical protein